MASIEASSLSARDKGTRFETLIRDWLMKEPTYANLFTKVQTWKDWSAENPGYAVNAKDYGIDLVATNADGDGFTAVQCKLYGRDHRVTKPEIDSFLAASSKAHFTHRLLVATNEKWSENVVKELHAQAIPVTLITRRDLAASVIDWSVYAESGKVETRPKRVPRKYQEYAIKDVLTGFQTSDRGKLIMACGTGKTFTSMKIAEAMEGEGGFVMFLVPSLSLLSQTLSDWKQQCEFEINAFAVCSDTTTGKADLEDIESLTVGSELSYPATTEPEKLAAEVKKARERGGMTVIFSTYQSIEVVSQAQKQYGMDEIGLIICDEAHRTAGGHHVDDEDAPFQRIHDQNFIRGKKRLYMTATPRIFGGDAKKQSEEGDVVLYSMDDEAVFGKTFHTISFSEAVRLKSLVDYKVIVLAVDESVVKNQGMDDYTLVEAGGLTVKHAAKVIGAWRALSKCDFKGERSMWDDLKLMKRAVGFAQVIEPPKPGQNLDRTSSKLFTANFAKTIEDFKRDHFNTLNEKNRSYSHAAFDAEYPLVCDCRHIDGSMNATEKGALLDWLRAEPEKNHCKILFNVRCLSEGVDVPSLDAVIFLSPRKSVVDVVQTVGRVMRTAPGKERGYVILPVVTSAGVPGELALNNNKEFDVVWQVLRALKSIDQDFASVVDGQLGTVNPEKIEVISITTAKVNRKPGKPAGKAPGKGRGGKKGNEPDPQQGSLFERNDYLEETIRTRILKRVGNRREWGDWAEDVAQLCDAQVRHIESKVRDEPAVSRKFEEFKKELKATLSGNLDDREIIEMLAQHVVTKPILDALFTVYDEKGDVVYEFSKQNPIAKAMTTMVEELDRQGMQSPAKTLKDFYESVHARTRHVKTSAERQMIIKELFEKFFKAAFPKQQEKLGIVYTPVEVVDFINQSVADLLKKEFGTDIADPGVHVLDPFSGTGTFMARLMQTGLIPPEKLPQKFENDLHANEIMPLAYYVSSMNLEGVFHEICPNEPYKPNKVMIWTDTFADHRQGAIFSTDLSENNARLSALNRQDIRVIIGNPPYSVGQDNANDDNQNDRYEELDGRIAETYAASTKATLKNSLYDSYVRAYRWASDRIGDKGVIGFVTNAGWVESNSADGMRKCMADEFNSIYVYHLKGNQRTLGERSRREGGKIFGEGSRAPVMIAFLVKNPESKERGRVLFHAIEDYLTREEKLVTLRDDRSIIDVSMNLIVPDAHGDWLNQRDDSYARFIRTDGKKTNEKSLFLNYSNGLKTGRDAWAYGSDEMKVFDSIEKSISFYNEQIKSASANEDFEINLDPKKMKWDRPQKEGVFRGKVAEGAQKSKLYLSQYRPFFKQHLYFDRFWNNCVYQMPALFPMNNTKNLLICSSGVGSKEYSCLMTDCIPCLDFLEKTQCFPRWLPGEKIESAEGVLDFGEPTEMPSGFTPEALPHFRAAYEGKTISEDDLFYYIYGILHSEDYRQRYANNLMKELPRIPRVATYEQFKAFEVAGRKLAELHVNFEEVNPYPANVVMKPGTANYRVTQMKWGKISGKTGNAAKDKSRLIYNEDITVEGIPIEAQEYVVNKKSALDWVVERACVKTDKASGIVNDFNDYAAEIGNPRYPLDLFLKVITVSLETMKIVKSLPKLEIHPMDK